MVRHRLGLLPARFWCDTFIYVGFLSGGTGLLIAFLLRNKKLSRKPPQAV
jgi:hypothetical protein